MDKPPRQPCRRFATPEGCPRGEKCQFSHKRIATPPTPATHSVARPQQPKVSLRHELALKQWLREAAEEKSSNQALKYGLAEFWSRALSLVTVPGSMQSIIKRLATEGGLVRIDQTLAFLDHESSGSHQFLGFQVVPLLELLTNEKLHCSFVIGDSLRTVWNYILGPRGCRGSKLFSWIAAVFERFSSNSSLPAIVTAAQACTAAFFFAATRGPVAAVGNDAVNHRTICRSFIKVLQDVGEAHGKAELLPFVMCLQRCGSILDDLDVVSAVPDKKSTSSRRAHIKRDRPGASSKLSPRHDNDFEDITQIQILPTRSEINSTRPEYLPPADLSKLHVHGIRGVIDRQFRLLREDTVGQLRETIKQLKSTGIIGKHQLGNARMYHKAQLLKMRASKHHCLDFVYSFAQPEPAATLGDNDRKQWWDSSRRLQSGALVCVLDAEFNPIFCTVSKNGLEPDRLRKDQSKDDSRKNDTKRKAVPCVFDSKTTGTVTLTPVENSKASLQALLARLSGGACRAPDTLVEFSGVLLQAFEPTLKALQEMYSKPHEIPFDKIFSGDGSSAPNPPAYADSTTFKFDLSTVAPGANLELDPHAPWPTEELKQHSTLDHAQAQAFAHALTRQLALIQGPPGTGKSFTGVQIIKTLIQNRERGNLGPILCVCYTNHALDQLLEHLLKDGVTDVSSSNPRYPRDARDANFDQRLVRIGSRSKSEALKGKNLREAARSQFQTGVEKHEWYRGNKALAQVVDELDGDLSRFINAGSSTTMRLHLQQKYQGHARDLYGDDESAKAWHQTNQDRADPLRQWLNLQGQFRYTGAGRNNTVRSINELMNESLFCMSGPERKRMFQHWISEIREPAQSNAEACVEDFAKYRDTLDNVHQESQLRVLQNAHVIGITTSGLARNRHLLSRVGCKVVVCEEAGEVLEAHMLTSILPSIQHAIMIGDHQQLRPQVQNYNLQSESARGKQYSFDISLFERLVHGQPGSIKGLAYQTLEVQRRMHPSISEFVQATLYPMMQNHESVKTHPAVPGLRKRVFWLDHTHLEAGRSTEDATETSFSNDFECNMTVALAKYLMMQGNYRPGDIAILTPYLGQLRKLRHALGNEFSLAIDDSDEVELDKFESANPINTFGMDDPFAEDDASTASAKSTLLDTLRLATVDNFQGEEAKVVLISMVRGNDKGSVGFLKTSNRINVLLSRAQHGMFIIGNSKTYDHNAMWSQVLQILRRDQNIGKELELCCARHPNADIRVKDPQDFALVAPDGGCSAECGMRLACGHICKLKCHEESLHDKLRCAEPCSRRDHGCQEHPCPMPCGKTCPTRCAVRVPDARLHCGHKKNLTCWQTKQMDQVRCESWVRYKTAPAGRIATFQCHELKNPDWVSRNALDNACLPDGNECECKCSSSRLTEDIVVHGSCNAVCGGESSTCERNCKEKCKHPRCGVNCSKPCTSCPQSDCNAQSEDHARKPPSAESPKLLCSKTIECGSRRHPLELVHCL